MGKHKVLRKVLSMVLAMAMVLSLGTTAITVRAAEKVTEKTIYDVPADLTGKTVILHSNDIHGAIGRYALIASVKQNLIKRGATVILADAGDYMQGSPYVSFSQGLDAVAAMNAAGYDIATLGNHEFDYGVPQIRSNLSTAKYKTVTANVLDAAGNNLFNPHAIITTASGLKVGFYGLTTPQTKTQCSPAKVKDITVLDGKDLYARSQTEVDGLKAEGADLVILLAHLGVDQEVIDGKHSSIDVYKNTRGIDFVIDAHSHTVMTEAAGRLPIQSTGTKLQDIGLIIVDNATKKIEDHYLISLEGLQPEVVTKAITDNVYTKVNTAYGAVFATSEVELNGAREPGNRTEETNNGDLITDAILWVANKDKDAISVDPDHIVAITNGGGIRAAITPGSVSKKDINTVLPFGNTVTVVYVTGEQLLEALEASTFAAPAALGGYPQTAGIKFTLDTRKSFAKGAAYPGSTYCKPASINRVTIESINGKPFSKTDIYAVATNDFCAIGGDTYYAFTYGGGYYDTGIPLDEAVMDYVKTELKGVISAEKYGTVRGDQTILK